MKNISIAIAIGLLSVSLNAIACTEQAQPPMPAGEKHEGMPMQGMHGQMMSEMMKPEHLKEMQTHMLLMHDLSNKILAEKDPKKQQALKDQQLEVMKTHMADRMARHQQMKMSHPMPEKK